MRAYISLLINGKIICRVKLSKILNNIRVYLFLTHQHIPNFKKHHPTFSTLKEKCFLLSMERPPPFKPPPPPIKYTCIQEPTGHDLPCHEMETL